MAMENSPLSADMRNVQPYDSMDDRLGQSGQLDLPVRATQARRSCLSRFMTLFDCGVGLHIFPIVLVILFPATFLTSYLIAVLLGHVEAGFPYISDTGTYSPESCIFGQFLNICSTLGGICIYIKYRHMREYYQFGDHVAVRLNKACLVLGMLACLGVSMVANFQETNVIIVHLIGANFAFGIGTVYCWVMWVASYRYTGTMNTRCHAIFRIILSIVATIAFIMTFTFASIANHFYKPKKGDTPRKWHPDDGGFPEHVVSTASEWVLALCILLYFGSFIPDFRKIGGREPEIFLVIDEEDELFPGAPDGIPREDIA